MYIIIFMLSSINASIFVCMFLEYMVLKDWRRWRWKEQIFYLVEEVEQMLG